MFDSSTSRLSNADNDALAGFLTLYWHEFCQQLLNPDALVDRPAPDCIATQPARQGSSTSTAHRFTNRRLHKEGGLGRILIAYDEELNREVVLKEMKDEFISDLEKRSQFLFEAEITGRLEHPGIVPVYGLGEDGDGRAYYVMPFIRGNSLKEEIRRFHQSKASTTGPVERNAPFLELLRRFLTVCDAIRYAHSRGVLHCDIKPANVVLGPYGETLVVDWGGAKLFNQPAFAHNIEETALRPSARSRAAMQTGNCTYTPAYASPEQARLASGEAVSLTPASDIYGLGAILYELVTGQEPFAGSDKIEVLERVKKGAISSPRQLKKDVPYQLDAICRKAMALEPKDRYTTVGDLAADIESWLADRPGSAWTENWVVTVRRWLGRHQLLMSVVAASLVVATVILSGMTVLLKAANDNAAKNFRRAQEAVNNFYTRVSQDQRLKAHGLELMRKDLLEMARQYYEEFIAERSHDTSVRSELAEVYRLLAVITGEIDSKVKAMELYNNCVELSKNLARTYPNDPTHQYRLGKCYENMALLYYGEGIIYKTEEFLKRALTVWQDLHDHYPNDAEFERDLAKTYNHLGVVYRTKGQNQEAEELFNKALSIQTTLLQIVKMPQPSQRKMSVPTLEICQRELAATYNNLGLLYFDDARRMKEAEKAFRVSQDILNQLASDHRNVPEYQSDLAKVCYNLGLVFKSNGNKDQALESFQKARNLRQELVRLHPEVIGFQEDFSRICSALGTWYLEEKRWDEAAKAYLVALDVLEKPPFRPSVHSANLFLEAHAGRAEALTHLGIFREAVSHWNEAIGYYERAVTNDQGKNGDDMQAFRVFPFVHLSADDMQASRVFALAHLSEQVDASVADALREKLLGSSSPNACYILACAYSHFRETADMRKYVEYTDHALALLRRAMEVGFFKAPANLKKLKEDSNLNPLRNDPGFGELLKMIVSSSTSSTAQVVAPTHQIGSRLRSAA
jgi:serine/threonine-protein kinase